MSQELIFRCLCETVEIHASGKPEIKAYCHCATCRNFYNVPVLAATGWLPVNVQITKGEEQVNDFQHPHKRMEKKFCSCCGETLFGLNRLGMVVIPNSIGLRGLSESETVKWSPEFHFWYPARVVDIDDELPKYAETPDGPRIE